MKKALQPLRGYSLPKEDRKIEELPARINKVIATLKQGVAAEDIGLTSEELSLMVEGLEEMKKRKGIDAKTDLLIKKIKEIKF